MYFNYKKNYIDHYVRSLLLPAYRLVTANICSFRRVDLQVAVPGGSNVTTQFAELFNSTPGDATTLARASTGAEQGSEFAFHLEHLKFGTGLADD
jgi:hypothetical protein